MDTAKVDVRKLQMLNDRINQTIDALNQVRMSVHGLSHTSPVGGINTPFGVNPFGQTLGAQGIPFGANGWNNTWGTQLGMGGWVPGLQGGMGLGHTNPFYGQAWLPGMTPVAQQGFGFGPLGYNQNVGYGQNTGYTQGLGYGQTMGNGIAPFGFGGLGHSTVDGNDWYGKNPAWEINRLAATFPFAASVIPPYWY